MNYCPTVDVIIPCYNVDHIVEKCINSVIKQEYGNTVKIYLINDGSTDNTTNILKSFGNNANLSVIHHNKNKGLSATRNSGIKVGNGEIICFLDSDMVVKKDWIESHVLYLSENETFGVIGDSKLPKDETANLLDKYFYDNRRGARQIGEGQPINFRYFLFNNASVKRSVFEIIDFFDENITSYGGEDIDLSIRIWEAYPSGLRFSSQATSEHYHKRELDEFCKLMYHFGKTNLPKLHKKYPQYKNNLCGQYINSIRGYLVFNPISRFLVNLLGLIIENYWLTRYVVVDSVIRGLREEKNGGGTKKQSILFQTHRTVNHLH